MDWGMMQDPYKAAQTACRFGSTGNTGYTMAMTKDVSSDGIMMMDDVDNNNSNNSIVGNGNPSSSSSKGHDPDLQYHHYQYQSCHHVCLRPRLRFGLTLSALIVVADSLLRFSWLLRFVAKFPSNDAFVLCTQFLEVFRRAIWNLLRVEWENIKQKTHDAKGKRSKWNKEKMGSNSFLDVVDSTTLQKKKKKQGSSSSSQQQPQPNNPNATTTTTTTNRGRKFVVKQSDHGPVDDDHHHTNVEMKSLL
jgi:hypothetical protein